MAITLTLLKISPRGNPDKLLLQAKFSGTYPTGGDVLNLSAGAILDPNALGVPGPALQPASVTVYEESIGGNYFETVRGAGPSTWKLQGFAAGGAEFNNAQAYPAGVLAGVTTIEVSLQLTDGN